MGNYRSGNPDARDNIKNPGKKGGRPKGSKTKINSEMKKDMISVYKTMGGKKGLKSWAEDHKSEFYYQLIKATIPKETQVQGDVNVTFSWIKDDTADHGPL